MLNERKRRACFLLFLIAQMTELGWGQNITDAKNLRTKLFVTDEYDFRQRPVKDQAQTVYIYVALNLLNINGVEEVEETLKTTAFLTLTWMDSELTWSPDMFGNIIEAYWPQEEVWTPDLTLINSYVEHVPLGYKGLYVHNHYQGNVSWNPFQVFKSTCSIDVSYFPFDVQLCHLTFAAWSYKKNQIKLKVSNKGIELKEFEPNPVWDIQATSTSATEDDDDSYITFSFKIRRHPSYFMVNVFLAIVVLMILNVCAFLLPCDSGEKNSYAVTVFLAFAIFLTIVDNSLPKNANTVSYFQVYLIGLTLQSTLITVFCLILSRLKTFDENETPVPSCLLKLSKVVSFCRCSRSRHHTKKVSVAEFDEKVIHSDGTNKLNRKESYPEVKEVDDKRTWTVVVNGLDSLCMIVFSVFSILYTLLYLILCPSLADK